MPILHPCSRPGCVQLVERGQPRCPACTTRHWRQDAQERGTPAQRGIDGPWRKLRQAHLAAYPFCVACAAEGKQTVATILHHKIPHRGNERLRLDPTNVEGLCRHHHHLTHQKLGQPGYRAPGSR
jgi:5-methylcytosine-specific restriction enzyme A